MESGVGLAGGGGADEGHHAGQEQLFGLHTVKGPAECEAQGAPHGPHQAAKQGLCWRGPVGQGQGV